MITFSEGSYAEIKSNLSVSVQADSWSVIYQARYISSVDDIYCASGECFTPSVESITYHDILGTYYLNETVTLSGGVNNLFDKEAPYYTNYNDSNTDPYTYDVLGRYFFVKANVKF